MENYKDNTVVDLESYCLECGDILTYTRKDKKFCSSKCRYDYYNYKRRDKRHVRTKIIRTLDTNYEVLERLLNAGCDWIDITSARDMGFNPGFVTAYNKVGVHIQAQIYDIKFFLTRGRISHIAKVSLYLPVRNRNITKL